MRASIYQQWISSLVAAVTLAASACLCLAQPKAGSPEAALQAVKAAIEAGDLKALGTHIAGEPGVILRKLAEPFTKAKSASDRLDKALQEKRIEFKNPFADGLSPLADRQFDLVEMIPGQGGLAARVKYGPRGKAQEETVRVQSEDGTWRIGAPAEIVKQLPNSERAERYSKGLGKLADILNTAAGDIEAGKLATKEVVAVRLVTAFEEAKLGELLR